MNFAQFAKEEFSYEEMRVMLNIVTAVKNNSRFEPCYPLRISTVYNIDNFDIATMEKWIAYWRKNMDAAKTK